MGYVLLTDDGDLVDVDKGDLPELMVIRLSDDVAEEMKTASMVESDDDAVHEYLGNYAGPGQLKGVGSKTVTVFEFREEALNE